VCGGVLLFCFGALNQTTTQFHEVRFYCAALVPISLMPRDKTASPTLVPPLEPQPRTTTSPTVLATHKPLTPSRHPQPPQPQILQQLKPSKEEISRFEVRACVYMRLWGLLAGRVRVRHVSPPPPTPATHHLHQSQPCAQQLTPIHPTQSDGGSRRARTNSDGAATPAISAALDAIKRSPLMLELPANHPGLAAVAEMVRFCCKLGILWLGGVGLG